MVTSHPVMMRTITNPSSFDYKVAYYIVTSYVLAGVLGVLITLFLVFHLYLICSQFTTIEFCEKKNDDESSFHVK